MRALAAVALLAAPPVIAAETREAPGAGASEANVLVVVRMGRFEGERKVTVKSYNLVVSDGAGSSLLAGQRVPFPAAGSAGPDAELAVPQSYVYQNVGFSSTLRATILGPRSVRLVAQIEDSRVRPDEDGGPPLVETRQLSVNAVLTDGVPLELTRVEGVSDQSGYVEVEARILR